MNEILQGILFTLLWLMALPFLVTIALMMGAILVVLAATPFAFFCRWVDRWLP